MFNELEAKESEAKTRAEQQLKHHIDRGAETAQNVFARLSQVVINDKLVLPSAMDFTGGEGIHLEYQGRVGTPYTIHKHALAQMAGVAGIGQTYVTRLKDGEAWEKELLAHNLNWLFHNGTYLDRKKKPAMFLIRHVGSEVRGFLSRSFNRKLMTVPLLKAFINTCYELRAAPMEAYTSDTRNWLKCMLPVVFEPVEGEFVAFGLTFSNSDFGAGRLKIAGTVMRLRSGTSAVLEDKYSRTHIGSVIQESDLEMSEETAEHELAAIKSAIKDVVHGVLSFDAIETTIKAIQVASEEGIHWHKLKEVLATVLNKREVESFRDLMTENVVDLPAVQTFGGSEEKLPSVWWVVNALGTVANKEQNPDKKSDIEALAGLLLKK